METQIGFAHFLAQTDAVGKAILGILLLMSVVSWYLIITKAIADHRIDTTRIYVTGLSLGGFGTWAYARAKPERVAAVVPIAGGGSTGTAVCAMRDVPVWAFHGDADGTVNVSSSTNSVNALNACSPPPAVAPRLTIYPGVGHDSWSRTYDGSAGHDIYTWLLNYRRP